MSTSALDLLHDGKILVDFKSMFSPYDFEKKMTVEFWVISKMNEIDKTNLTDQTKFRLNEMRLKIILTSKLIKEKDAVKNQVNILLRLIT